MDDAHSQHRDDDGEQVPASAPPPSIGLVGKLRAKLDPDVLKIWGPVAAVCVVALVVTWVKFVGPPPPDHFRMLTGSESGAYHRYAQRYAEVLRQQHGVDVELVPTKGAGDNLSQLVAGRADVGFVQSGIVASGKAPAGAVDRLVAIASMYREPLWVFHRGERRYQRLEQLAGKRVAAGPAGSGTRSVVEQLLAANGRLSERVRLVEVASVAESAERFLAPDSELDAVCFVASPEADYVRRLLDAVAQRHDLHLMHWARAKSYGRALHYLSAVEISEGLLDLPRNVPAETTLVVAPTAMLVAHEDFHPAIQTLLLDVAGEVHRRDFHNLLDEPGEFPSEHFVDLPMSRDATRYLRRGKSFLHEVLPFWAANTLSRLKVLLLPLLTLLLPLVRVGPPVFRWRIRSRIYKWYELIRKADLSISAGAEAEELEAELDEVIAIERDLRNIDVPLSYMEEFYHLRLHLDFIRKRLEEALAARQGGRDRAGESLG